ncbi:MAG: T9SS type A sorting domain-containing protein [Ignavibacteriaceae bacterium]
MKKLLSFFSLLTTFTVISIPLLAQETNTNAVKNSKTILVSFSVNMELERLAGYFHPGSDTVSVGGNFNAWEKAVMTVSQSNPDIYSTTISVTDSIQDTIRFNFVYSPDVWEVSGVHEFVITQSDYDNGLAATDTIGFNSEPPGDFPIRVEFRCNMAIEMRNGEFVKGEKVFVRGDFNGWSGNDFELKDVDGDSIYSRIFYNFKAGQKLTYKFTNTHNGQDVWESVGNRVDTVSLSELNIFSSVWEDACFCTHYKTIQVTFSINMELERLAGYFNPLTDTLSVRGSFNGWSKTVMAALPDSADIYRVTTPVVASVDEKIVFKFFYSPGTWEQDNLDGNFERVFIVTQEVFNSGSFTYDAIGFNHPDPYTNIVEKSKEVPTSFSLSQNFPNPFNPSTIISWQLAVGAHVTLKVFDVLGNEVATLVNEEQPVGSYQVEFSSKNTEISSGVFFYQLRAGEFVQTKKMILMK